MPNISNRALAIFGIITYLFAVIASAKDLKGNFRFPYFLVVIGATLSIIFLVMSIRRLWKVAKPVGQTFLSAIIINAILEFIGVFYSAQNGGLIILLLNISVIFFIIAFIWAIITLFRTKNNFQRTE
jgi:FtsH-binding integral membrane protein